VQAHVCCTFVCLISAYSTESVLLLAVLSIGGPTIRPVVVFIVMKYLR